MLEGLKSLLLSTEAKEVGLYWPNCFLNRIHIFNELVRTESVLMKVTEEEAERIQWSERRFVMPAGRLSVLLPIDNEFLNVGIFFLKLFFIFIKYYRFLDP